MRILHTSDWHLNDRLGRIPRQGDIVKRLEEIAAYLDEYKVDVMVVAGDLFSQYNRVEELKAAMGDISNIFKPFLLQGGTIVTISGNHDNEAYFNLLRFTLDLADPIDPKQSGARPGGRLYLVSQPTYLQLEDKTGQPVQFVLMPYPTSTRYLNDKNQYTSLDEKNRFLYQAMIKKINQIKENNINPKLPSILVSHAHIRGSEVHSLYRISEREDVIFETKDMPTNWAYAAFGHIHKPQSLAGTTHVRYSGSIERLDYGEKDDDKSVVLVEIGSEGRIGEPVCLPLNATPIYRLEIGDPVIQIPSLKDKYPNAERALVSYKLVYKPGEHNRDVICRELETIFPRWYDREVVAQGSELSLYSSSLLHEVQNVPATVRKYLADQLKTHPDCEDILALAEQLLSAENI